MTDRLYKRGTDEVVERPPARGTADELMAFLPNGKYRPYQSIVNDVIIIRYGSYKPMRRFDKYGFIDIVCQFYDVEIIAIRHPNYVTSHRDPPKPDARDEECADPIKEILEYPFYSKIVISTYPPQHFTQGFDLISGFGSGHNVFYIPVGDGGILCRPRPITGRIPKWFVSQPNGVVQELENKDYWLNSPEARKRFLWSEEYLREE